MTIREISILIVTVFLLISESMNGQDVAQWVNGFESRMENPFELTGQVGLQFHGYGTSLKTNRASPFNAAMNANLSIDLLGVETPLSYIYSSGGSAYNITLPSFAFAGLSPSYRGYTLHIGDRSLMMGKYSFNHHSFRGVGCEIKKQGWYLKNFYGRLQRAQASDYMGFQNVETQFRRKGWGILAGVNPSDRTVLEFSLFKAWEDPASLVSPVMVADKLAAENVILSTKLEQQIGKKVRIAFEFANSGYTASRELDDSRKVSILRSFGGLLLTNTSTRWNNAFEVSAHYDSRIGAINLTYERIDPGYRTMGALFFQDDQENITAGISSRLWKNRITVVANAGIQNSNLNNDRSQEYARFLGSAQLNVVPMKWFIVTLGYSNFLSVDRQIRILDPGVPARLTELALNNGNLTISATATLTQNDILTASLSNARTHTITQDEMISSTRNVVNNFNALYRRSWPTRKINASIQFYRHGFDMEFIQQIQNGVAIALTHHLIDQKLDLNLNLSYANNRQKSILDDMKKIGNLWQFRPRISWSMNEANSLLLDGALLRNSTGRLQEFQETRVRISYISKFKKRAQ